MTDKEREPTSSDVMEMLRARTHEIVGLQQNMLLKLELVGQELSQVARLSADHEGRIRILEALSPAQFISQNQRDHDDLAATIKRISADMDGAMKRVDTKIDGINRWRYALPPTLVLSIGSIGFAIIGMLTRSH